MKAEENQLKNAVIIENISKEELKSLLSNVGYPLKNEERIITQEKTAEILGVTVHCLKKWHYNGTLKARKIGAKTYYTETDILNAMR